MNTLNKIPRATTASGWGPKKIKKKKPPFPLFLFSFSFFFFLQNYAKHTFCNFLDQARMSSLGQTYHLTQATIEQALACAYVYLARICLTKIPIH